MILRRSEARAPLALRSISVAYRGVPALWDVSWEAREGSMTAIVGPNGAGKSSLLNAAIGALRPLAGEAFFWGQSFASARSRVAYVPQRESVDWDFPVTALQVVEMGAARRLDWLLPDWLLPDWLLPDWLLPAWVRRQEGSREHRAEARSCLEDLGLGAFADRPIGQLSGGQQQRVFLARAMAQQADLLLLDEPFAGVDSETEDALFHRLRSLCDEGTTIIAVHHDLESARTRFDDALLLSGSVIATGSAREALSEDNVRRAFASGSATLASSDPGARQLA